MTTGSSDAPNPGSRCISCLVDGTAAAFLGQAFFDAAATGCNSSRPSERAPHRLALRKLRDAVVLCMQGWHGQTTNHLTPGEAQHRRSWQFSNLWMTSLHMGATDGPSSSKKRWKAKGNDTARNRASARNRARGSGTCGLWAGATAAGRRGAVAGQVALGHELVRRLPQRVAKAAQAQEGGVV